MYYTHKLRSQIQEWRNRVYKSNYNTIATEFLFFWKKMHEQPIVVGIINEAKLQHLLSAAKRKETFNEMINDSAWFEFDTPIRQVSILYQMQLEAIERNYSARSLAYDVYTDRNNDFDTTRDKFVEMMIQPVVDYINDMLDDGNSLLYLLEKYKRRVEWFVHGELIQKYEAHSGKKEDVFDDDLRLYLFNQGIDYPLSRPRSASGEPDIVGMIDTNNPLILEVKYYDGVSYRKNRIIEGFAQVVKYAGDYNKNIGYLVVFNLTQTEINLSPKITVNNFRQEFISTTKTIL